jgi:hypothetical protein
MDRPTAAAAAAAAVPVPPAVVSSLDGFAWDVQAEEALEDVPPEEEEQREQLPPPPPLESPSGPVFTSTPLASYYYTTPLPYPGTGGRMSKDLVVQQQQQQQQQPPTMSTTSLTDQDITFFRTLFQPGDTFTEKDILDSFLLDHPGFSEPADTSGLLPRQPQHPQQPFPPQAFSTCHVPIAPGNHLSTGPDRLYPRNRTGSAASAAAAATALPLVTAGAMSEYNFPRKLYRLLQDCEGNPEYKSIVSWSVDGRSFKVHDKKRFVEAILPNYFDQTQYASFRRQLNMYSFVRQSMSTYSNPNFCRGQRGLIDRVVRKASGGSGGGGGGNGGGSGGAGASAVGGGK